LKKGVQHVIFGKQMVRKAFKTTCFYGGELFQAHFCRNFLDFLTFKTVDIGQKSYISSFLLNDTSGKRNFGDQHGCN